ncbi:HAD family hydrolase [Streptomyces sp. NPDC058676]|uniref:HAD family hydrolase n=1 Tax=unclassified Streptomyces TaxID=2593676 RepID=UPI0036590078
MTAETGQTDVMESEFESLQELVAQARYVLFDFDGPICRLFPGSSAEAIARDQVEWLRKRGLYAVLTEEERVRPDPHGVLSTVARRQPPDSDLVVELEEQLTQHELKAIRDAMPTAWADPLIRTWVAVGVRLAIATNNSARTVHSYLNGRGLIACFAPHIYGRTQDLSLLKPHPETLNRALRAMGAPPESSLMIGDTVSDHAAAQSAGVPFLGYARTSAREQQLRKAGAQNVLRSLEPLLSVVREHS